jgi:hypothetical protein
MNRFKDDEFGRFAGIGREGVDESWLR